MIIGLHGKIGAGKDATCEIMRYFLYRNAETFSFEEWSMSGGFSNWRNVKISHRLKEIVSMLTGYTMEQIEDRSLKDAPIKTWKDSHVTLRTVMNEVGTEIARKLNPDIWIMSTFSTYDENEDDWIITDVRFPGEADYIRNKGGIIIDIKRDIDYQTVNYDHLTETAMNDYSYDYVIDNNGSIEDLKEEVKKILMKADMIDKRIYKLTYDKPVSIDDWYHILDNNIFNMSDVNAYWGKSSGISSDNAFCTPSLDADCVFIYPK